MCNKIDDMVVDNSTTVCQHYSVRQCFSSWELRGQENIIEGSEIFRYINFIFINCLRPGAYKINHYYFWLSKLNDQLFNNSKIIIIKSMKFISLKT